MKGKLPGVGKVRAVEGEPSSANASGTHDPTQHLALLFALFYAGTSGVLEIRRGPHRREIYLLDGSPAWVHTTLERESLQNTVVADGLVARSVASAILDGLDPEDDPGEVLVESELLRPEVLQAHLTLRVERLYTAALAWDDGEWTLRRCEGLHAARVEHPLRLPVPTLRALWAGVRRHVAEDAAGPAGAVARDGQLQLHDRFDTIFPALGVDPVLEDLSRLIRLGVTVEKLRGLFADTTDDLGRLLWLLHTVGAIDIEGVAAYELPDDPTIAALEGPAIEALESLGSGDGWSVDVFVVDSDEEDSEEEFSEVEAFADEASEEEEEAEAPPPATESVQAQNIRAAHQARMGRDYYAFLDCRPDASRAVLKRSFQRFEGRWKVEAATAGLPLEVRRMVQDLLGATRRVWKVLSDDRQRGAYDARLEAGSAPVVESGMPDRSGEGSP